MKQGEIYEEQILDKIVTIVQIAEEEIEFGDKIDTGIMKRAAYNEILKVLKENNYVQDVR